MLEKIISGGQTGADQAALDVAMELGMPHGGWIPKGRLTEAGPLPDRYELTEMPTASDEARTEQNVVDSDGTLIFSHGHLNGGSALTRTLAKRHGKPWLHLDLDQMTAAQAAQGVMFWVRGNGIRVLNVAGPRASKDPFICDDVRAVLKVVVRELLGAELKRKGRSRG
ncbi:MAG: putative molybdenum carrier protein [bacterium]